MNVTRTIGAAVAGVLAAGTLAIAPPPPRVSADPGAAPGYCVPDDTFGAGCIFGDPAFGTIEVTGGTQVGGTISVTVRSNVVACSAIPPWERETKICASSFDRGFLLENADALRASHVADLRLPAVVPVRADRRRRLPRGERQLGRPNTCTYRISNPQNRELADLWSAVRVSLRFSVPCAECVGGSASRSINAEGIFYIPPGPDDDPTADCAVTSSATTPGTYFFDGTGSQDLVGNGLVYEWDFGDGTEGTGALATHSYDRPGTYEATLTVSDGNFESDSDSCEVEVTAPELGVSISLLDGAASPLDPDENVRVRVTVSASGDGVGDLSELVFPAGVLSASPADLFDAVSGPDPAPEPDGFTLAPGTETSFVFELAPIDRGRFTLATRVTGEDGAGEPVSAEAESNGQVGTELEVTIALLTRRTSSSRRTPTARSRSMSRSP